MGIQFACSFYQSIQLIPLEKNTPSVLIPSSISATTVLTEIGKFENHYRMHSADSSC